MSAQGGAEPATGAPPAPLARLLLAPSLVDWIGILYVSALTLRLAAAPRGHEWLPSLLAVLGVFAANAYVFRLWIEPRLARRERPGWRAELARTCYRLMLLPLNLALFRLLRFVIPAINARLYDAPLYRLDLWLFGAEPTILLERVSSPVLVEIFAFFYFSYYHFVLGHVLVLLLACRDDRRLAQFAAGFVGIFAVGHFTYTLVPGFGPYAYLAHEYQGPLVGGVFFGMVLEVVSAGGALRDIFPSLHTAIPVFCSLYAWRHYRSVAPWVSGWALAILLATMVLRWHYAVDVLAGILLAVLSFVVTPRLVEAYQRLRERAGLGWMLRW